MVPVSVPGKRFRRFRFRFRFREKRFRQFRFPGSGSVSGPPCLSFPLISTIFQLISETGRIRFRGARLQTPNSVSFLGSLSSGERTQRVPLSLLLVCKSELTEFFAELTEFAPKLSEAQ